MVDFENVTFPMTFLGIIFVALMVLIAKGSVVERKSVALGKQGGGGRRITRSIIGGKRR